MTEPIHHLAEPGDWAASGEEYRAPSLEGEGFLHCSTAEQLARTARELYGDRNDLILLTIDVDAISAHVVYEDLYDRGEDFPHIYGPLPARAVLTTGPYITHLEEGLWLDTRFERDWMDKILHADFTEVGMSGRTYSRDQALAATANHDLEIELPLEDYRMSLIDEDVALVRYVSRANYGDGPEPAERCSVWINTNEGWRLRYHQGTPLP